MQAEVVLKYPVTLLTAFLVTFLFTPMARRLARAIGAVARPGERHIHHTEIPKLGGVAVFLGFHSACAVVQLVPWLPFSGQLDVIWYFDFLLLSTALLILGLLDDLWQLQPWMKLIGQIGVAVFAFTADMRVGVVLGVDLPLPLDLLATVIWYITIINAFNLIDGIDGLAAGLAGLAGLGLAGMFLFRHQPRDALTTLGLVGACTAFLRYNTHPASVFLGDCGSMFLGFTLAAIALSTDSKGPAVSALAAPILAFGVPLLDTVLAVWRRTVSQIANSASSEHEGGSAGNFHADADHVHHRLLRVGVSQRRAAVWLYLFGAFLVATGLLSMIFRSHALGIYILAFVVAAYLILRYLARVELWDSSVLITQGLRRPETRVLAELLLPVFDSLALTVALAVTLLLAGSAAPTGTLRREWFDKLPVWVGVPFLCFSLLGIYRRAWGKARISDYMLLGLALAWGVVVAAGLAAIVEQFAFRTLAVMTVLFWGIAFPLVAALRAFPRFIQETAVTFSPRDRSGTRTTRRILVYGTGTACALFLAEHMRAVLVRTRSGRVEGLLDEDPNLHGRLAYGLPVLVAFAAFPNCTQNGAWTKL
ncbi:MAG: hypothetical protein ACUVWX_12990 [Kiritimatiellia bacterium]